MTWRHIGVLLIVNLAWATNTIVSKFVVSTLGVAPLFYTSLRFALVAIGLIPWLFPLPAQFRLLLVVGFLTGGLNFGLFFTGLSTSEASSATIVGQIGIPMTVLLSVLILGERIDARRAAGIGLTILGSAIVAWDPGRFVISFGLIFVAASALSLALGAVLLKRLPDVKPLQVQAWVGVVSAVPLGIASALFEPSAISGAIDSGWILLAAALYSAGVGSILGYTAYYALLQKYEANMLVPLTLLTPLLTIAFGIALFGETLDARKITGSVLALAGVLVIAWRKAPAASGALAGVRGA